jgi:NADH:ubiquinone oxidoreductase subunit K
MTIAPVHVGMISALAMVGIGFYGLMILRNLIKIIVALQITSKGVIIALVTAGIASGQIGLAQSLAVTFILADTIIAVVGLALAVQMHRRYGTLDLKALAALRDAPPEQPG